MKNPVYSSKVLGLDKICMDDDIVLIDSSAVLGGYENDSEIKEAFINETIEALNSIDNLYLTLPIFRECSHDLNGIKTPNGNRIIQFDEYEDKIYEHLFYKHLSKKDKYELTSQDYDFLISGLTSFMRKGITSIITNDLGIIRAGFSALNSEGIPPQWLRFFGRVDYNSFSRVISIKNTKDSNKDYKEAAS